MQAEGVKHAGLRGRGGGEDGALQGIDCKGYTKGATRVKPYCCSKREEVRRKEEGTKRMCGRGWAEARSAFLIENVGVICIRGEVATGGRGHPERANERR